MSEAPERIWAFTEEDECGFHRLFISNPKHIDGTETEYLRADLAKAAEAAAYERAAQIAVEWEESAKKRSSDIQYSGQRMAGLIFRDIRAMIDPDAASALDAVRAEVRRECAGLRTVVGHLLREREAGCGPVTKKQWSALQRAYAAAIMEGKSDE